MCHELKFRWYYLLQRERLFCVLPNSITLGLNYSFSFATISVSHLAFSVVPFSIFFVPYILCPSPPTSLCRIYSVSQWSQRMNSLYSLPDFKCYLTSKKNCIFTFNWYCLLKTKVPAEKNVCRRRNISSGNLFLLTFWLYEIRTKWTERVCARNVRDDGEASTHVQDYE